MTSNINHERGIILVMAILTMLAMAIFLPALIFIIGNETKWSVAHKKSTIAFQMAEQGLDRGIWKLQESDDIWNQVSTGGHITGYNYDVIYVSTSTDDKLGEYMVKLTTYTENGALVAGAVKVQAMGHDKTESESRGLEAVYTKIPVEAGLQSRGALSYKPNLTVHWGPVICYTNIDQSPTLKYPRKVSKGYIKESGGEYDENPNLPNGHDIYVSWPDPPTYDYNSYQTKLGNPPTINLSEYKSIAKKCSIPPLEVTNMRSSPTGSGYYEWDGGGGGGAPKKVSIKKTGSATSAYSYYFSCSTCVIYSEYDVEMIGNVTSYLRVQALIVGRDFDMNASNGDLPSSGLKIPTGAKKEYLHTDASSYWYTNFHAIGEGGIFISSSVRVVGYIYVGDDVTNSGGATPAVAGIIDIVDQMSSNNLTVYYDASVSTGILASGLKPRLQYWREFKITE